MKIDYCERCDLDGDECSFCQHNPVNQADENDFDPDGMVDLDDMDDPDPDDEDNYDESNYIGMVGLDRDDDNDDYSDGFYDYPYDNG